MKVFRSLSDIDIPFKYPCVTIGNFDGVHIGHQALFKKAVELAGKHGGHAIAVTFEPHPIKILRPNIGLKLISTFDHKLELIKRSGVNFLICLEFNMELASTSAKEFLEMVFVKAIGVKELIIGYDYAFGRGREGDRKFLRDMGEIYGYNCHVLGPIKAEGEIVSSTKIRELVSDGNMKKVRRFLGRYYQIRGIVRVGNRRGGPVVGFPTANILIEKEDLCPKVGVYCVQVIIDDECFGGVMNIGYNPTFGDTGLSAEVHIFNFQRNIYGKHIKVNLIERIREERKFSGPKELQKQIKKDIDKAILILAQEKGLKKACKEEFKINPF